MSSLVTAETNKFGKFLVQKASEMPRKGAVLLLYGSGGAGKTTLCATAPGRKVFLDYDRRTNVLAHLSDVDIIEMSRFSEAKDFFSQDPAQNWDIMVLDNATELASIQVTGYSKDPKMPDGRQWYNAAQADMVSLFKACKDYASRTGTCIIWTAWESRTQVFDNGIESTKTTPMFAPALANQLLGLAQFVGYIHKKGDVRTLTFDSDKLPVKWGVAPNDVAAKIPREIVNPSLDPILRTLIGGEPYKP